MMGHRRDASKTSCARFRRMSRKTYVRKSLSELTPSQKSDKRRSPPISEKVVQFLSCCSEVSYTMNPCPRSGRGRAQRGGGTA
ncbi:hypothetical protein Poly41_55390 [Novipirellula artificiosorum]|uniref:Uncharacterized protein n=1 Tax=Novipirellula artificiosorum TaxID=2528016 RepID=A0A5C6D9X4_9BACT|nr:hypothetical protein Poly41_55390 [Novipirellula artificiosorum]